MENRGNSKLHRWQAGGCRNQGNLETHRRRDWKRIGGETCSFAASNAEGWRSEATRSSITGKPEDAGIRAT